MSNFVPIVCRNPDWSARLTVIHLMLLATLFGCSLDRNDVVTPSADPIDREIASAIADVARASVVVAEIERNAVGLETASSADLPKAAEPKTPESASNSIHVNWNGPIEPLLSTISKHGGFNLHVSGRPIVPEVHVSVDEFKGSTSDAIAEIDAALFGVAAVSLDLPGNSIILAYPN